MWRKMVWIQGEEDQGRREKNLSPKDKAKKSKHPFCYSLLKIYHCKAVYSQKLSSYLIQYLPYCYQQFLQLKIVQCPMSFSCTLFFPQISEKMLLHASIWHHKPKLNLNDNFWSWPTVSNFWNEMQADGWMNDHKLIIDFCIFCEGCYKYNRIW